MRTPDTQNIVKVLWTQSLGDWAHQMIIKNGIIYSSWNCGKLSAIDLKTGKVLGYAEKVAYETAPIIVDDKIYSYTFGTLTELDLNSLSIIRKLNVVGGEYSEYIPYDKETDCFFLRRSDGTKSYLSSFNRKSAKYVWTSQPLANGVYVVQGSPVVIENHVIAQGLDNNNNYICCWNKTNGQLIWKTSELGYATMVGYNNFCYDRINDILFGSTINGNISALDRKTGKIIWQHQFPYYGCWSTMAYHNKQLIVSLWKNNANGAYAAVDSMTGNIQWQKNEFFGADGWSAVVLSDKYIYRTTHSMPGNLIIQRRDNGDLVWSDNSSPQPCTNPLSSGGIVVFGNITNLLALKVGEGQFVDCDWHGVDCNGYNPTSIQSEYVDKNNNTSTEQFYIPPEVD